MRLTVVSYTLSLVLLYNLQYVDSKSADFSSQIQTTQMANLDLINWTIRCWKFCGESYVSLAKR